MKFAFILIKSLFEFRIVPLKSIILLRALLNQTLLLCPGATGRLIVRLSLEAIISCRIRIDHIVQFANRFGRNFDRLLDWLEFDFNFLFDGLIIFGFECVEFVQNW